MQALGPFWQLSRRPNVVWSFALVIVATALGHGMHAAEIRTGASIYAQQCAKCHGADGQGSEDFPEPLIGTMSIGKLTQFIDESMPEESPEECAGADAARAAAFVFESFYSSQAQARRPSQARIELSRITVRQYRNAVTDLLATFREPTSGDDVRGLRGSYYNSRRVRGEPAKERIDSAIDFDFGTDAPMPDGFDPHQFSIRWEGSIVAPETGVYDFYLRTDQSARMWFNDTLHRGPSRGRRQRRRDVEFPFIDAFVKSGTDDEYKASAYLLGGRAYPVRIEFSKAKQGVDDSDKNPPKPKTAAIELLWRLPKRAAETIPRRSFLVEVHPEVFVVKTPFPPDDRSVGYERGTSISKGWDEATTEAAIEVAGYVVEHLAELAKLTPDLAADQRRQALTEFCRQFVERAFRRPLTASQEDFFVRKQIEEAPDLDTAVKRVVLLALKTPRFLYQDIDAGEEHSLDHRVAAHLSFGLWDSLPDSQLLAAAQAKQLSDRDEVESHARRMVRDVRARAKLRSFLMQWLKVEDSPSLVKSETAYPGFDDSVASDLRTSLELTLDAVLTSEEADFRDLLLDESLFLNGRLAPLYGVELPPDAPFQRVGHKIGERAGVLTHPYLMSRFAYTAESSPIHRGVFLARNVLGRALRPPAEAFSPLPADLHPNLTTRERVALQTKPKACLNCHSMINPLGFTLENFDAIGRYRDKEGGRSIDARGGYRTASGESLEFAGVRDLAEFLANDSQEAHHAFATSLFHYLVKQPIDAFGPDAASKLRETFENDGYSIHQLMVEIMVITALRDNSAT